MCRKSYINVSSSLDALSQGTSGNLEGVQVEVTLLWHEGKNNTHHNNNGIVDETKGKKAKTLLQRGDSASAKFLSGTTFSLHVVSGLTRQMQNKKKTVNQTKKTPKPLCACYTKRGKWLDGSN